MKCLFSEEERATYPVTVLCRVMQVARSGYYAWRKVPLSTRKVADMVLLQHIRDIFAEGRQTYGSTRIQGILAEQGVGCGRERVARLIGSRISPTCPLPQAGSIWQGGRMSIPGALSAGPCATTCH